MAKKNLYPPFYTGIDLDYHSLGYVEGAQLSAQDTLLTLIYGFNPNNTLYFFQLFDTSLAPAPGAIPIVSIQVPGVASFSLQPAQLGGKFFGGGLSFHASTTGNIYTPTGIPTFWVNAEFKV